MKKLFLLFIFFLVLVPCQLVYLHLHNNPSGVADGTVAGIQTNAADGNVFTWAFIGEYQFTLFGYTSPGAVVTIDGQGINDQTTSDSKGYFAFANSFSPLSPREACLSSRDKFGRISSPVCLPPFPTRYNVNIGPVLIPPTVSLNKDTYYTDDQIILSGQAIPNSNVDLSVFTDNSNLLSLQIVKPVSAFTFPKLTAKSDSKGNFSLVLPSAHPDYFRLFAQSNFDNSASGNSTKLNFQVYPVWMTVIRFFLSIFDLVRSRFLELLIFSEIIYLVYFVFEYLLGPKALMIAPIESIVLKEKNEIEEVEPIPLVKY